MGTTRIDGTVSTILQQDTREAQDGFDEFSVSILAISKSLQVISIL